jgi:hypothetical protein
MKDVTSINLVSYTLSLALGAETFHFPFRTCFVLMDWFPYLKTLPATATCLASRWSIVGWMFFTPYTTSSVVLEVDDWSVVDFSVLDCSSVIKKGVDEGEDSSVIGEVSVVSVVLLPVVPELLPLGLELLDEGRGSVTWKPNINSYEYWI